MNIGKLLGFFFKKSISRLNFHSFTCHADLGGNYPYTFIANVENQQLIKVAHGLKILLQSRL